MDTAYSRPVGQLIVRLVLLATAAITLGAVGEELGLTGADWELRALGVRDTDMLEALRSAVKRPVTLAIVGQGGVSKTHLEGSLVDGNTLEVRMSPEGLPSDPGSNTHDTQAAQVILDLTRRLGMTLHLMVYQPGEDWAEVAQALATAGREARIVTFYQSFWGDVGRMVRAIAEATDALFISPYGEVGDLPTSISLQSYARKPGGGGIPHFVTAIPLARTAPGRLLTMLSRPGLDTETVNFIAPSYYADGPGGTCPAAEVTAAVAAFIVAAAPEEPAPTWIVELMLRTSSMSRDALLSVPEFSEADLRAVETQIAAMREPKQGASPQLEAAGVLNLAAILSELRALESRGRTPGTEP